MNDKIETSSNENNNSDVIMKAVMSFLAVFMPITLVKRVLSLVLIAAGIDNKNINRLTGYGESTIRKLKSDMRKKKSVGNSHDKRRRQKSKVCRC